MSTAHVVRNAWLVGLQFPAPALHHRMATSLQTCRRVRSERAGTHQGLSNNLVERERDRKTTGSEGGAQPLLFPDKGKYSKIPVPRSPASPRAGPVFSSSTSSTPVLWEGGLWPNRVPPALELGYQPLAPLGASLPGSRLAPTSLPTSASGMRGRAALLTKHSVVPGQVPPGWLVPVHVIPGSLCSAG